MLNAILFDLDGTLIPMAQEAFIRAYFHELAEELKPLGYEKESLIKALWHGTAQMVQNDGSQTNREVFWADFCQIYGEKARLDEPLIDRFYQTRFDRARSALRTERDARPLIETLRQKGYTLALATNPLFPAVAVDTRLNWVGLKPEDFSHITHYANSRYSKPNPNYFAEVLKAVGRRGEECLMVGNNVQEDMVARELGCQVYLVNDDLENENHLDTSCYPQGTYREFEEFAKRLPKI